MKKQFGVIVNVVMVTIITLTLIHYLGSFLGRITMGDSVDTIKAFYSLEDNSLDVIGFGSSHMWAAIDSSLMYEDYGLRTYNYGDNWQRMDTTLLFLKDSLLTQHPKYVIIETYMAGGAYGKKEINGEVYYTRAIRSLKYKYEYLKHRFGNDLSYYLYYSVPLFAFHDNWGNITKSNFSYYSEPEAWVEKMGYPGVETVTAVEAADYHTFEQKEFTPEAIEILDEIVNTCQERNIEVIFITTPMGIDEKYKYYSAMEQYAKEKNCTYFNFYELFDELGIDWQTDFYDGSHLNKSGADKVTKYIGDYIISNS